MGGQIHQTGAFLASLLVGGSSARAQDIEPRVFSNAPVGMNFLVVGDTDARGAVPFDPSVPITEARITTTSAIVGYARVLDLWGKSAKVDAIVPYTSLSGTALYAGDPVRRDVDGFVDPRFRLSVNLYGAPALKLKEYHGLPAGRAGRRKRPGVGAGRPVRPEPAGQYRQ